jgi:DNA mismatch repair protein MutS2
MDKGGLRATLEAGGMRVLVDLDDLEPALGQPAPAFERAGDGANTNASALRLERARSVASSLDLRGARVEEALEALGRYLDDASLAGLGAVTVVHGMGTGALRDAVREAVATHPLVRSARPGERGEGGDGATIVSL